MAIALAILTAAFIVISTYGVLLPHRLIELIRGSTSGQLGLWSAVTARLLLAALLWLTARLSRTPTLFAILAAILVLSAIAHPIVGRARLRRLLELLASWPLWAIRVPCLLGVAMGGFVLWSISPAIGAG